MARACLAVSVGSVWLGVKLTLDLLLRWLRAVHRQPCWDQVLGREGFRGHFSKAPVSPSASSLPCVSVPQRSLSPCFPLPLPLVEPAALYLVLISVGRGRGPGSEGRAFSATHLLIPRGRTRSLPSHQPTWVPVCLGEPGFAHLLPEAFLQKAGPGAPRGLLPSSGPVSLRGAFSPASRPEPRVRTCPWWAPPRLWPVRSGS